MRTFGSARGSIAVRRVALPLMAEASEAGCGIPSTADLLEQVAVSLAQDQKKAEEQAEACREAQKKLQTWLDVAGEAQAALQQQLETERSKADEEQADLQQQLKTERSKESMEVEKEALEKDFL